MPSQESDGNFIYYFYEADAMNEPTTVPFDRFVTYVNKHPGTQFFLFADRCTKDKIDGWLNNDHVTVHWWKDITPELDADLIPILAEALQPTERNYGAIIEISPSVSLEELSSICYGTELCSAGELMIARNSKLPNNIIQHYENIFNPECEGEDCNPFQKEIYNGWALMVFYEDNEGDMGLPHRPGYISVYPSGDIDDSFFDWGIMKSKLITRY